MKLLFAIGIGGFFGSVSRFLLINFVIQHTKATFPLGTLIVNVLGSFVLGIIMTLSQESSFLSPQTRVIAGAGFLGAFTTFSTFSYENYELMMKGSWGLFAGNILVSIVICLVAVVLGSVLARIFI